uniref:Uncharacterized protein n=1 Tax=Melanopsichium pennsylvanicum 4 TaxID=1398559 RepID=A0A077QYD7_9BASI|nr:uncharacterized protein BN887_06024 [Melanopsichium pennsylvanicum 4]
MELLAENKGKGVRKPSDQTLRHSQLARMRKISQGSEALRHAKSQTSSTK